MSKYYKAKDIFQVIDNIYRNATETDVEIIKDTNLVIEINKLPTIEVSEDCVDKYSALAELDPQSYKHKMVYVVTEYNMTDEPVATVFTTRATAEKYRDIIASGNGVLDDSMYCVDECKVHEKVVENTEQSSKVGKWIAERYCSECEWDKIEAEVVCNIPTNYCPNCGCKMKG